MGESLSHSECDMLLPAVEPRSIGVPECRDPISMSETDVDWKPHDFRKLIPLPAEAMAFLRTLQEGLCQRLESRFHSLLGKTVCFRPVGLETVRFEECNTQELSLTCQFTRSSSSSPWGISWEQDLVVSLIDSLLGGESDTAFRSIDEPPSEIERLLLGRLSRTFLSTFDKTGSFTSLGQPHPTAWDFDPNAVSLELAGATYIHASFEMTCNSRRGLVHCWLPSTCVSEFDSATSASWARNSSVGSRATEEGHTDDLARSTKIEIAADLAHLKLRAAEVSGLSVGDVLMTDVAQFDDAMLRLGRRRFSRGAVGTLDGKKAIRLSISVDSIAD